MIVTRRRKKKRNWTPVLVPAVAAAALGAALWWPPSHDALANGPLRPIWSAAAAGGAVVARPLTFAAQQQHIADQQREMNRLNASLEADRKAREERDSRIAALQGVVARMQAAPQATPEPLAARPRVAAKPVPPSDPENVTRTAAYWASMDAEKAAAVIQRLPDDYVNRVFRHMPPDAVGDIMNALPAKAAARLSAEPRVR